MRSKLLRITALLAALLVSVSAFAQDLGESASVQWSVTQEKTGEDLYRITFTGRITDGMHIYAANHEFNPTKVTFTSTGGAQLEGALQEISKPVVYKDEDVLFNKAVYVQDVRSAGEAVLEGTIGWQACTDTQCGFPEEEGFSIKIGAADSAAAAVSPADGNQSLISDPESSGEGRKGLWALIIEAILWGFAMLLTPCVFPMVPMTISFFLKGSDNVHQGRFKAFMYGLFIVLLYTVPIAIIIGLTWVIGGGAVTASIFNWLATHWLPNILFFLVFMVFAASFFGAFEITLPSSLVNKSDKNTGMKGRR